MSGDPLLDPDCRRLLDEQSASGDPPLESLGIAAARATISRAARDGRSASGSLADVTEMHVEGARGPLPARWYVPRQTERGEAMLLYFHGGGFALGGLDTHDDLCRRLARGSGACVLSVDYRLAPEDPFPAQLDDARAAWASARELAPGLGCDPSRIGVAGDSAGGNLAAAIAVPRNSAAAVPACQLLIYPWLDMSLQAPSVERFAEGFGLSRAELRRYRDLWLGSDHQEPTAQDSPALIEDLRGASPAYVATAGFDPLRDEAETYAERLRAAGVEVTIRRHAGLIHGFVEFLGLSGAARDAVDQLGRAARRMLTAPTTN
jgi:acetyl esterase